MSNSTALFGEFGRIVPTRRSPWRMRDRVLIILGLLAGCEQHRPPPPSLSFGGLPVSGTSADALRLGFSRCIKFTHDIHCQRKGVMLEGQGPFDAAVDLEYSDGSGGFDRLTLWNDWNQDALLAVSDALKRQGWKECFTGSDRMGDQAIYTREGSPVFVAMDLSYWVKRRLRVLPLWNKDVRRC